jgi:hypothetical protein
MPSRNAPIARLALLLALAVAVGAGCGSGSSADQPQGQERAGVEWLGPQLPIAGLRQRTVGNGPRTAVLLWSASGHPPRQAVIFLHGLSPRPPSTYGAWLRHLAQEGNTIVYPAYAELDTEAGDFLENAIAGIAAGLGALHSDPAGLVAVGDISGGALAFDYAAAAAEERLPGPRGVFAVFPGRAPPKGKLASADLSRIPPRTLLEVVAGPGDYIPAGEVEARALLRGASRVPAALRRRLSAPTGTAAVDEGPRSRRALWAPLDRLIGEVRGAADSHGR